MSESDRERGPRLDLTFGTSMASDLEWVLQSSQVEAALVSEALLHTFYSPIVQMTRALEPAVQEESPLVRQAFVSALHHRYRFRSGMDATRWFYTVFVDSLPRTIRQDAWPPLAIVLYAFSGLNSGQVASLLKTPAKQVKVLLHQLDKQPLGTLQEAGWTIDGRFALEVESSWREAFTQRFAVPTPVEEDLEQLAGEIAEQAERQGFLHNRLQTVRELALVGLAILAVIGILLAANRLFPATQQENAPAEPTRVFVTRLVTRMVTPQASPSQAAVPTIAGAAGAAAGAAGAAATPTRRPRWPTPSPVYPAQLPMPLSTQSNSFGILERIKMSPQLYHTVWADAWLTFYGGLNGEGASQRMQVWISDNQLRLISGPLWSSLPQEIWVGKGDTILVRGARNRNLLLSMERITSLKRVAGGELRLLTDPLNPPLIEPGKEIAWDFRAVGIETVAGRSALIVDQVAPGGARVARLWLDRDTAFVLRSRHYQPGRPENLILGIELRDVRFDIDFVDQRLFDSVSGDPVGFSDGPFDVQKVAWPAVATVPGFPTPLPPAPADFDPSQQALDFIYPLEFDLHQSEIQIEIAAGGYRLGKVDFGNPWMLVCSRSQDGRRIAFASRSLLSGAAMTYVGWFDLANLDQPDQRLLEGVLPTHLAFSPDGRLLAAYGSGWMGRGVYLTRVDAPHEISFFSLNDPPLGLVWDPASQYLAWVTENSGSGRQLTVVSFSGTQPVYQGAYASAPIPLTNAPAGEWQVPLPTSTGGLEDCAHRPVP